jgi:RNA polymerase sigma factor (sigma-70 family)
VDWRRANGRTEVRSAEWWEGHPSIGATPDEEAASADMKAMLYRHVEQLDSDLRATVHCHYYQELTLQETADALGIATSTVKYRLRQALSELQKRLDAQEVTAKES